MAEVAEFIPACVIEIAAYWRKRRPTLTRAQASPSRCPSKPISPAAMTPARVAPGASTRSAAVACTEGLAETDPTLPSYRQVCPRSTAMRRLPPSTAHCPRAARAQRAPRTRHHRRQAHPSTRRADRARTGVLACWGRGKQTTSQRQANRLAWRVWPLLRRRCRALAWGHKGP